VILKSFDLRHVNDNSNTNLESINLFKKATYNCIPPHFIFTNEHFLAAQTWPQINSNKTEQYAITFWQYKIAILHTDDQKYFRKLKTIDVYHNIRLYCSFIIASFTLLHTMKSKIAQTYN